MQAPVFNSGVPTADGYYLSKVSGRDGKFYFEVWKLHEGRWVNSRNEPILGYTPEYLWARIPNLGEWSDKIADAPLGADILIIDEYGKPQVSDVSETEDTPHKRQWRRGYENPGLWHLISAPIVENFDTDTEDQFNVEGRKASYGGFKSRDSYGWYYAVQEMKRYQTDHDQDSDCNQDVDCMTPDQINDMLAAVEDLKKRTRDCGNPVHAILPPSSFLWTSDQSQRDWCTMILNLPYRLPEELHGIPRELRNWCLEVAHTKL